MASTALPPEFTPANRPVFSWLLLLLLLLLILLSAAQLMFFLRTELAANHPQLRPYLEQACTVFGCQVELPRNIQLLTIDDSDLQEDVAHQDVIVLTSTLSNQADYAQAFPLLELTLTDLDERPVLRRIFTPKEYLSSPDSAALGIPPRAEVRIKLSLLLEGVKATGYRVYLTYP